MKFLLINKMKDASLSLPPAIGKQMMVATDAWVKQKMKEGTCLETYLIPGRAGSAAILEYDSAEDLARDFIQMPCGMYMDNEFYPLADWDTLKYFIEALDMADKMMPGPG